MPLTQLMLMSYILDLGSARSPVMSKKAAFTRGASEGDQARGTKHVVQATSACVLPTQSHINLPDHGLCETSSTGAEPATRGGHPGCRYLRGHPSYSLGGF